MSRSACDMISVFQFHDSEMSLTVVVVVFVVELVVLVLVLVAVVVVVETGEPVFVRYLIPVDGQEPALGASR